jgi:hypothetical protein
MNIEITEIDLRQVKRILDDLELTTRLIEKSDKMPISSIILNFNSSDINIDVAIAFIPLPEDIFPDVKILQFFYEFPEIVVDSNENLSLELTNRINYLLPIGSFGLKDKKITYRYCHLMPIFSNLLDQKDSIKDLIKLIALYTETFKEPINNVMKGTLGIDEMFKMFE